MPQDCPKSLALSVVRATTARLWRFIVECHARKQIRSDAFNDAFGKAEAQIEEQLALAET